jgi:hypothetical protein
MYGKVVGSRRCGEFIIGQFHATLRTITHEPECIKGRGTNGDGYFK